MFSGIRLKHTLIPTFDSPKVGKSEAPHFRWFGMWVVPKSFFVSGGDIFCDRLVTFYSAVRLSPIRTW